MSKKKSSQVLGDEDLLELSLFVFDERPQEKPRPGQVELQENVVVRVGQVAKIGDDHVALQA